MIHALLLSPEEFAAYQQLVEEAVANAPQEFDFDSYFTYGLGHKVWKQFGLRSEVVKRVLHLSKQL